MNSDFLQQQAELLARRVAPEADTTAKINKAYRLIFGRPANDAEVRTGIEYLKTEPMKEYEERRAAKEAKDVKDAKDAKDKKDPKEANAATNEKPAGEDKADIPLPVAADGMMAGVVPGAGSKDDEKTLLLVTTWGRYVTILLSSSEFLFGD